MRHLVLAPLLALLATTAMAQTITGARFDGPTDRYAHGVLGDSIEYEALVFTLSDGRTHRVVWGPEMVFEDIAPRLVDLDGDGTPEVIVVESHQDKGARMAIWGMVGTTPAPIAATPHIGTRFRWLAPIGVADLDSDGQLEIAYIDRPHLARTLRVWRFERDADSGGRLTEIAHLPGLSNHKIGWDHIPGGIRSCGATPEIITADADWQNVISTRLEGGRLKPRAIAPYTGPSSLNAALTCD